MFDLHGMECECGGVLLWAEAGNVPGWVKCDSCGWEGKGEPVPPALREAQGRLTTEKEGSWR